MSKRARFPFDLPLNPAIARAGNLVFFALLSAVAAGPALAGSDYPPGLFENSPVVPPGGREATDPSQPPDAAEADPPDEPAPLDDYCASIAGRTFHSLEEVRRAHARCDPDRAPQPGFPGFPTDQ